MKQMNLNLRYICRLCKDLLMFTISYFITCYITTYLHEPSGWTLHIYNTPQHYVEWNEWTWTYDTSARCTWIFTVLPCLTVAVDGAILSSADGTLRAALPKRLKGLTAVDGRAAIFLAHHVSILMKRFIYLYLFMAKITKSIKWQCNGFIHWHKALQSLY